MQSLASQGYAFGVTILIGMTIGIFFDMFKVTKGVIRPRKIFAYLGDFLFWLFSTTTVFLMLLIGNWGEIRFYVIIGVVIGAAFYMKFVSRRMTRLTINCLKLINKFFCMVITVLAFIWRIITYPVFLVKRIVVIPIGFVSMVCSKVCRFVTAIFGRLVAGPTARINRAVKAGIRKKLADLFRKK